MFEFSRGNYEQKSVQILEATRGLSSTDLEGTHLIECLRSQLSAVTEEIKRLRQENATLTAEHDALRAERDEVRKSYCSLMEAYRGGNGRITANKLGWGYLFEENRREVERLTTERDEARREVCELRCNPPEPFIGLPHELAKVNGWDCYRENTDGK